jgi:histidinol-phosphatase (PHP family)
MPIKTDYHLHSHHSTDSKASMEDMIQKGIALGLNTLCFTEHQDFNYPKYADNPENAFLLDTQAYASEFDSLQKKYSERINLRFGIECGMQPVCAEKNRSLIRSGGYDFVLGSVHLCDGRDPYYPDFFKTREEAPFLRRYFEETLHNIEIFQDFDSLAHIDYMVRYCTGMKQHYDFAEYEDILTAILEHLVHHDKALELNTGGLRKGMTETNPGIRVIKRFHELGGKIITVGSDAHKPEDLAASFSIAEEVLRTAGYDSYVIFEKHVPIFIKL